MGNLIFLGLLFLSACGRGPAPATPTTPLLDEFGRARAVRDPQTGLAPFGVYQAEINGQWYFCSVTHVTPGVVVTSAHCLDESEKRERAGGSLLFYDRAERLTQIPVGKENLIYLGRREIDDVALLRVPAEIAAIWDSSAGPGGANAPFAPAAGKVFAVKLWSFDPIRRYPLLAKRYGRAGAIFAPKICQATYVQPTISGGSAYSNYERLDKEDPPTAPHLYYDQCDRGPVGGNSGSLITAATDFTARLGVHQKVVGGKNVDYSQFLFVEFIGATRKLTYEMGDPVNEDGFYWAGMDARKLAAANSRIVGF